MGAMNQSLGRAASAVNLRAISPASLRKFELSGNLCIQVHSKTCKSSKDPGSNECLSTIISQGICTPYILFSSSQS